MARPILIGDFLGEIPRRSPRLVPDNYAQVALNTRLEDGTLWPFRNPLVQETFGEDVQSIYLHGEEWLGWPEQDVSAVPGPVASDRLYITGTGAHPKLYNGGTTYSLAVPAPATRPEATLRNDAEYITVDSREFRISHGRAGRGTVLGVDVTISVSYSKATITITHDPGLTPAQAQSLIGNIYYRNGSGTPTPAEKIIRVIRLRDDGGVTLDANRNPIGSDTRTMNDVGTVVRVNGAAATFSFGTPAAQSGTDTAGQNDPPTLTLSGGPHSFAPGDPALDLFSSPVISTVEAGQKIILVELTIDGLINGLIDPNDRKTVVYCYTYVTQFDEESQPSPLSKLTFWSPGQAFRLTGFQPAPPGRGIDRMRIYRSETGSSGAADLFFLAEIPSINTFWDDLWNSEFLNETLPSLDYDAPLATLQGLIALPNGIMAAYSGKEVFFSEPYRPHAWPAKYALKCDFNVMGLAAFGSAVAILTDGPPYIAQGTHPETMRMERVEVTLPCINRRSIVDLGEKVAYASWEGLATISAQGAGVVSDSLFTEEQWYLMAPGSFVASRYRGRYMLSHDQVGAEPRRISMIDLTGQQPYLIQSTLAPIAYHFDDRTGDLYYLHADKRRVYRFDDRTNGNTLYTWRSKVFDLAEPMNFGAIIVVGADNTVAPTHTCRVYADGVLRRTITGGINEVQRLPSGFLATRWEVEVAGNARVNAIVMAISPEELTGYG